MICSLIFPFRGNIIILFSYTTNHNSKYNFFNIIKIYLTENPICEILRTNNTKY
jgi:hypothetical protein